MNLDNYSCGVLEKGKPVTLLGTSVHVQCTDLLAEVVILQRYRNTQSEKIYTYYVSPLIGDLGSLEFNFEATVDGKKIITKCKKHQKIISKYENLLEKGAFTYSGVPETVYHIGVGELAAEKDVIIRFSYLTQLKKNDNSLLFSLPKSIGEIDAKILENWNVGNSKQVENGFSVMMAMEMNSEIEEISCSVSCTSLLDENNPTKASLEIRGESHLETDCAISVKLKDINQPRIWIEQNEKKTLFSYMFVTSPKIDPEIKPRNEIVIVSNLNEINSSLLSYLKNVPENHFIKIIGPMFEEKDEFFSQLSFWENTAENIEKITSVLEGKNIEKGTVISSLKTTLASDIKENCQTRQMVFLCNFLAESTEGILDLLKLNLDKFNISVLGLNDWKNHYLSIHILQSYGCDVLFSKSQEDFDEEISSFAQKIHLSPILNPTITFPEGLEIDEFSLNFPPLITNKQYVFYGFGKIKGDNKIFEDNVLFSYHTQNNSDIDKLQQEMKPKKYCFTSDSLWIHKLAARAKSCYLQRGVTPHLLEKDIQKQITKLGTKYGIVTKYTSFISAEEIVNEFSEETVRRPVLAVLGSRSHIPKEESSEEPQKLTRGFLPIGQLKKVQNDKRVLSAPSDLRSEALRMHKSVGQMLSLCADDYKQMTKLKHSEVLGYCLNFTSKHIQKICEDRKRLSSQDEADVFQIVNHLITNQIEECIDQTSKEPFNLSTKKINEILEALVSEKGADHFNSQNNLTKLCETYSCSAFASQGEREHMEDYFNVCENVNSLFNLDDSFDDLSFFGVYDGHSGKLAAEYTKSQLVKNLFSNPKLYKENINDALQEAYNITNSEFIERAEKTNVKAGTTVVTVILNQQEIIVANVGDSECVLSKKGEAKLLTTKHTPNSSKEKERVEQAGGTLFFLGTWRVDGILAVTRSIGDKALKNHVISEPSILIETRSEEDEFLILATDGLWDVLTYQEAIDFVINCLKENIDVDSIGEHLTKEASKRKSKDNTTAVVIFFSKFLNNIQTPV